MSKKSFTDEEKLELQKNPYIKHVGDKGITYTKEFKEYFIREREKGNNTTVIFKSAGFDTKLLGRNRIDSFSKRIMKNGIENLNDRRKGNSGRPKTNPEPEDKTPEEIIKQLKHQNALLEQENEFLKKTIFLAKKTSWTKSLQQKDTK